ncbi:MAG: thioredoxin [Actinomycetes bacterium]
MSAPRTVTRESFEQLVDDNDIVLLDFWAAWCGPCRSFAPVFEQAARDHPDIVFGKVDTEAEPELAAAFGIRSIPTIVAVREQTVVFSQPGALPPAALAQLITAVRGLDMGELRASSGGGIEVDIEELERALADGALVLDVREPEEHAEGHVAGTRLVPLRTIPSVVGELPRDRPVYLLCRVGQRRLDAAHYLVQEGVDARSVAGGTVAWEASGRPLQR